MAEKDKKNALTAKILILGDSSVGKSSLLMRFTEGVFSANLTTTVGIDYKMKKIKVDDLEIRLQIWDTAGQEKYRALAQNYYKNAMGVLLVFDLTEASTFENVRNWIRQIKNHAGENICKILVANKCDMTEERQVQKDEIKELAQDIGMECFEVSAKSGENVESVFMHMSKDIRKKFFPNAKAEDLVEEKKDGKKLKTNNTDEDAGISKAKCC
jgi:Ras-related protein Rab-8A